MSILESLRLRGSARNFGSRVLEAKDLEAILEASAYSPRAGNFQQFSIRVFEGAELERLSQIMLGCEFARTAKAVLLFYVDLKTTREWFLSEGADYPFANSVGYHYALADSMLAMQCCALVAEERGIATRVLSASLLRSKAVALANHAPLGCVPTFSLALGFEAENSDEALRRHNSNWRSYTRFGFKESWPTVEDVYIDTGKAVVDGIRFEKSQVLSAKRKTSGMSSWLRALSKFKYRRSDLDSFSSDLNDMIRLAIPPK